MVGLTLHPLSDTELTPAGIACVTARVNDEDVAAKLVVIDSDDLTATGFVFLDGEVMAANIRRSGWVSGQFLSPEGAVEACRMMQFSLRA